MGVISLSARQYIVRNGDNLDSIAKANGYRDWQVIYRSRCNDRLRALRPNPNQIKAGDVVMIPPRAADIRQTLRTRLDRLKAARKDTEALFDDIQGSLNGEFKKLERVATTVDTAKDVFLIFQGLGKMCWKGYKSLEMGAEELTKANKELAKEALNMPKDQFEDLTLKSFAEQQDHPQTVRLMNSPWMFSVAIVRAWLDITSPSYWAGVGAEVLSGNYRTALKRRPSDIFAEASTKLADTRRKALAQLDAKIRETEQLMSAYKGDVAFPLPMK